MNLNKVRFIRLGLVVAAMGLAWITQGIENSNPQIILLGLAVIALISTRVVEFLFWRCPSCGKFLNRNGGDHCQWCGEGLYE